MNRQSYEASCQELSDRILILIPDNLNILEMDSPFDLFKIKDFKCDDLQPSLAQATFALGMAKARYSK